MIDRDSDLNQVKSFSTIWVNPGVAVSGGEMDTIFAEAGSTIGDGPGNIVFLKPGASYIGHTAYVVVRADGASIDPHFAGGPVLECNSLAFDYSDAPPNVAFPVSSVKPDVSQLAITLTPNPTTGVVQIQGASPSKTIVSVFDELGRSVIEPVDLSTLAGSLDLSKLLSGVYYVRFSAGNSVVTKKVVKE